MARRQNPDPRTDRRDIWELLVRLGMIVVHSTGGLLRIVGAMLFGILRMIGYLFVQVGRFFGAIGAAFSHAFREHGRPAREIIRDIKQSRGKGIGLVLWHGLRLLMSFIFGEYGILRTGFNYILPVISILFLIGIVRLGSGLDYALSVSVSGEELGIISSEGDFDAAEYEVKQRLAMTGEDISMNFSPVYDLRIVNADDQYLSVQTIADKLLAGTGHDLRDAYGVYVDGEFIGAVEDRDVVASYMDRTLEKYAADITGNVNEVYYTKSVTYEQGVYLAESLSAPSVLIRKLSAETKTEGHYVTRSSDTPQIVADKHSMTLEELEELNPDVDFDEGFEAGMLLYVTTSERYIPIAFTRTLTETSYIDYTSVRVETAALNLGVERVISHGSLGERSSEVLVTFVDGVEKSRQVLSTVVTKEPVAEQIGVGTYGAQPANTTTVLSGTGKYGWPVNGGYISSPFGGERRHKGLDIAAPMGTEIYAAEAGTVYRAGWNSGGYGNYVIIDHPDGYRTLYGHASSVVCYEGQQVEKGQLIALVGSTGDSTGPHCHFEVRVNNICVDPALYLRVND